jgi:hypothetical protein
VEKSLKRAFRNLVEEQVFKTGSVEKSGVLGDFAIGL